MDTFQVDVQWIHGHYVDHPPVWTSVVLVLAQNSADATLAAAQMVGARGMKVLSSRVDWDNF